MFRGVGQFHDGEDFLRRGDVVPGPPGWKASQVELLDEVRSRGTESEATTH